MTNDTLQELATLGLVAMAALYITRRVWHLLHPDAKVGGCGSGCGSCPSNASTNAGKEPAVQIVTIGLPRSRPEKSV
ncbi:MAG: hypothetical protein JWN86_1521 [Planctomycetota bacterium]|nr:hypothetical protein [Planctomycetota bacterium]